MRTQTYPSPASDVAAERSVFGADATVDLMDVLGMLRRRKWLIMLVTALGTVAAALLGMVITPTYTAKSAVMVDPRQLQIGNIEQVLQGLTVNTSTIATQIGLLQSETFLASVMDDLHLFDDPEFNPSLRPQPPTTVAALPTFLQPVGQVLSYLPSEWLIATGLASQPEPLLESQAPGVVREKTIDNFTRNVSFLSDGQSYLIQVSFTSEDPEKAAVISNRISELYIQDQINSKLGATDKASGWLEQRLNELRTEVQKSDEAVQKFKTTNNIVEAGGTTLNDQELSDLNRELVTAQADLAAKQSKLRIIRDMGGSAAALQSVGDVTASPMVLQLRQQQIELERQESQLRTLYGDRHPLIVQLKDEKAKVAAGIREEVSRVTHTLENDVKVASVQVGSIQSALDKLKNRSVQDRVADVQLQELDRVALANRTLYEQLLARFNETQDQQGIVEADARVIAKASPPVSPSSPGPKLFAAAGFTVSFLLGSLMAVLLERLDRGLRSAREVESALGLTTLGLVPRVDRLRRKQRPHQYLREKPLSSYAEAIRGVLTALRLSNPQNPPRVLLVTSSLPEEGKTTFAVSLASLVARSQKRVLLIDLDLRHPSVHRELGWQVSAGLVEYMAGERTLQEVIHNDLETGLHFLPVKAHTTTPTDLLESDKMRELLQVCRENYDLIVLDSAPVASVNDTKVAAGLADRVVFIVRWGKTIESAARDSLRSLREAGIEPAGAVLAQIDLRKHAQYRYGDIGQYYTRSRRYYVN
ncbi:MAG: Wzz/FepE/Etk N-terminal domain-containing protein [Geminicoccaceae bacterium]